LHPTTLAELVELIHSQLQSALNAINSKKADDGYLVVDNIALKVPVALSIDSGILVAGLPRSEDEIAAAGELTINFTT
jgi:hypothetical protein